MANTYLEISVDVTEYRVLPPKENVVNVFNIDEKSMVINLCNAKEEVISQSEISKEDAIILARQILKFYK